MKSDPDIDPDTEQFEDELPIEKQTLPVLVTSLAQAFSALGPDDQKLLRSFLASQSGSQSDSTLTDLERSRAENILDRIKSVAFEPREPAESSETPAVSSWLFPVKPPNSDD